MPFFNNTHLTSVYNIGIQQQLRGGPMNIKLITISLFLCLGLAIAGTSLSGCSAYVGDRGAAARVG